MGSKNCPETPRQKMINMMYIVLTAMLALNVASEVLEAFRVVDSSLNETLRTVDMKNAQVYASFDQAYAENATRVSEWKDKADYVRQETNSLFSYIAGLKEELITKSGFKPVNANNRIEGREFIYVTQAGDSVMLRKEDDLNVPSEFMITQKNATQLKENIEVFRSNLIALVDGNDTELIENISAS